MKTALIISDPDILDGTPVFSGTRVPVKNLTDCLAAGDSIDAFLEDFPTVSRAQVVPRHALSGGIRHDKFGEHHVGSGVSPRA